MARPAPETLYEDTVMVPAAVRFPVELAPPEDFDPARLETWPQVEGSLEWVAGSLLWMPPCGDRQQDTVVDLVTTLGNWVRGHPEFVVGSNEAGMRLGQDTRAADAAVWRRADRGRYTGEVVRVAPALAAEVAGRWDREPALREKAQWYLEAGVRVVWLLLPVEHQVVVVGRDAVTRHGLGERLPEHLPGLAPAVDDLFRQVLAGGA